MKKGVIVTLASYYLLDLEFDDQAEDEELARQQIGTRRTVQLLEEAPVLEFPPTPSAERINHTNSIPGERQ